MKKVLIIGGGFCGTMLARSLGEADIEVVLVERSPRVGAGVAFGSCAPEMLLNVPAGKMGASPEAEDGFLSWSAAKGEKFGAGEYVRRRLYAEYLQQYLPPESERFRILRDEAITLSLSGSRFVLGCSSGELLDADAVVLTCGNLPRRNYFGSTLDSPAVFGDPWEECGWIGSSAKTVLLAGSSLTAADVALHFLDRSERKIVIVSRHGKLPLPRGVDLSAEVLPESAFEIGRALGLHSLFRELSCSRDWRAIFEGIRGQTTRLWQSLPPSEQRRFLRHASTYWNIHRHRLPNETHERLERAQRDGRLEVIAGRILAVAKSESGIELSVRPRSGGIVLAVSGDIFINCLGPADRPEQARGVLFENLLRSQLIRAHPNGVGLAVEKNGYRVLQADGKERRLFTVGHWLRGDRWESTAVPQLRVQVRELAALLVRERI